MLEFNKPVVVLGPMRSESAYLISSLENVKERRSCGYTFYEGYIDGYPTVVCRCFIGVVNSAVAAALAAQLYSPLCIIIQGTSGAHDPELHQGDIVLGERLAELGSFITPRKGRGEGCDFFDRTVPEREVAGSAEPENVTYLYSDSRITDIALSVPYSCGKVVRGTIGAADIWNRELDVIAHLHETIGTSCEEMEGFGVAQVCRAADIPCADIRVISNSEWYPDEEFDQKYGEYCQMFVLEVIRRIIAKGSLL